jgi:ubiquinone/menaquinone biosynthesis C-methylase UbiE
MLRSIIFKAADPIHTRLRAQRSRMAIEIMQPASSMSLLDVGGSAGFSGEYNDLRSLFRRVVVVNLDPQNARALQPNVEFEVADGCALPYPDESFDWVFSNAVIEHVGDRRKQEAFAREIQRVARLGYFVATPNRHFFLDPHTYFPFYHVLPEGMQRVAIHFSFGHMKQWEPLRVLSAAELRQMFPSAEVKSIGPLGTNLVVHGRKLARPRLERFAESPELGTMPRSG